MGDNAKKALIDGLNGLLADHLALYMKTKNFHWHVKGPQFRELHLLFDEQAAEIFGNVDIIAERVRKIEGTTLTSIAFPTSNFTTPPRFMLPSHNLSPFSLTALPRAQADAQ